MADSSPQVQEPEDLSVPRAVPRVGEEIPGPSYGGAPPWWLQQDEDAAAPSRVSGPMPTVADFAPEPPPAPEQPPPHPGPAPRAVVDAVLAPAAAPAGRRGGPKIVVGLAAGAVLVLAVAAGGYAALARFSGPPEYKIVTPASVAGMRKDTREPAAGAAYPFVSAGVENGAVAGPRAVAVYLDGARNVLFMGGTGAVGDPAAFLRRARPSTTIRTGPAAPARNGGQAVCGTFAVLADVHAYCAWATETSYGVVASNTPSALARPAELRDLMRRLRPEVERPR
ncbi:hypothetical protein [Actinomadura kijaniata]|uniref:hypothetical protein n=1 Tax=Actinomadura kijaniata TaxID=46161 RepID=UPI0008330BEC|nr:hypothetical protein [Actinomadura kijaniata]